MIFTMPLFWLYLFFLFLIFIFLTNRISFHPPCGENEFWWTARWSLLFVSVEAGLSFLFLRTWDFSWDGFLALPLWEQLYPLFVALWIFWMVLDHFAWKFLVLKPVPVIKTGVEKIPVADSFKPPFAFLKWIGLGNQIYRPQVTEYELRLKDWPQEFSGMTIVQISDLHYGHYFSKEYLDVVLKKAKSLKPDLYAFTGDFINWKKDVATMSGLLKGFKAKYGAYAVLGNHDMGADPVALTAALKKDGIRVMDNEVALFKKKGKTLAVMGAAELWFGNKDVSAIRNAQADAKLLLAHHPDHFYLAKETNTPLQLSGHCHGGQICFPLIGPLIVPSSEGRKYAGGFYKEKESVLFVTNGIGCYPPLRTLCPPEIVKLTIITASGA
jgi:predicted MPP superfamily phosphohydrolase